MERQIRYLVKTDTAEQNPLPFLWIVCFIMEPRGIRRKQQLLLHALAPEGGFNHVGEVRDLAGDLIEGTGGIYYKAIEITADKSDLTYSEKRKIYNVDRSQFKKDRRFSKIPYPVDRWFGEIYIPALLRE